jgi:cell division septum initiation protein DivIVA
VHEFLDSIKDILYKYGSEYEDYLQSREETKRKLSGAKDVPSDAKSSLEAQKIRIQANKYRALNGEQ